MARDVQAVIVGGGILGCALAWRLALRGIYPAKSILVIDAQPLASQASSRAAALLSLSRPAAKAHWIPLVSLADLAVDSLAALSPATLERFDPARFGAAEAETPEWRARCIAARAGKTSG